MEKGAEPLLLEANIFHKNLSVKDMLSFGLNQTTTGSRHLEEPYTVTSKTVLNQHRTLAFTLEELSFSDRMFQNRHLGSGKMSAMRLFSFAA